jgi:ferritin-like metal-binding protein YciE
MKLDSMQKLMIEELRDLYDAEQQLVKALPKMAKAASAPELKAAFEEHLAVTREQVDRLRSVFEAMGQTPRRKACHAMEGLVEEGSEIIEADGEPEVKDAALIAAAQRVEHYEIAGYGCAATWAERMNMPEAARLLRMTLEEEKETDVKLTQLAETLINAEAAAQG